MPSALLARVRGLLGVGQRDAVSGPELADDGTLRPLGGSRDAARADSEVVAELASGGVDLSRPVLVVHLLRLPTTEAVQECARLVAEEGYTLRASDGPEGPLVVRVSRAQRLTGLSLAQERSRMAGLAQRLGGDVDGWEALGVPTGQRGGR